MSLKHFSSIRRGDTLIEVSFAIAIFSLVSLITITMMNAGLAISESSLEVTMARGEIDAQADALRFIQSSYLSEMEMTDTETGGSKRYQELWNRITSQAIKSSAISNLPASLDTCDSVYSGNALTSHKAFIINTRNINPNAPKNTVIITTGPAVSDPRPNDFQPATLHPRIIFKHGSSDQSDIILENDNLDSSSIAYYNEVSRVEGIWIIAVKSNDSADAVPEFYDFHIRTCWYSPGKSYPSTIATIIRLYNPNYKRAE